MSDNDNFIQNKEYNMSQLSNAFKSLNLADKVNYKNRFKELNLTLTMNQFPEINDLYDSNYKSVLRNLKIVSQVLEDRHKLIEQKNELAHKISKLEGEQLYVNDKTDTLNTKIKELTSKVDFYKNKLSLQEKKADKELDKLQKEKDEVQKNFMKISLKENQYKHEIKKFENMVEELKARLKRYMNDNKEIKIIDNKNERIMINSNTIIFDNFLKNSPSIIFNQVNYSKDFYNLIFKSFNDKLKSITQENTDLKKCFQFLKDEIIQYNELKKQMMYKFAKEKFSEDSEGVLKDCSSLINMDVFNLDFNTSKNEILQLFSEIIDNFRFLLMYDIYKISPETEFSFEQLKSQFKNKKYDLKDIPYYEDISETIEKLNLEKLEDVKKEVEKVIKKEPKKVSMEIDLNIPDLHFQENEIPDHLNDLDEEIQMNVNNIEDQFRQVDDYLKAEIRKLADVDSDAEVDVRNSNSLQGSQFNV